jgi:hypothetical protein
MLIALLAVLGVDLVVIVAFLAAALHRRRWIGRQAGAFKGAIRVVHGEVPGLTAKWRRGYGRWIRDILVWYKPPLLFRSEHVPADALARPDRASEPGGETPGEGRRGPLPVRGGRRPDRGSRMSRRV